MPPQRPRRLIVLDDRGIALVRHRILVLSTRRPPEGGECTPVVRFVQRSSRGPSRTGERRRPHARRYAASMIVRVLTATVSQKASGELHVLMRQQLPLLREYDGLLYVKLARRLIGNQEEIVLFEEWRDTESMYKWTGPDISRPRLLPGAEELITDLRITHFEALDIDPVEAPGLARFPGSPR
jgi:hypothetical protein